MGWDYGGLNLMVFGEGARALERGSPSVRSHLATDPELICFFHFHRTTTRPVRAEWANPTTPMPFWTSVAGFAESKVCA